MVIFFKTTCLTFWNLLKNVNFLTNIRFIATWFLQWQDLMNTKYLPLPNANVTNFLILYISVLFLYNLIFFDLFFFFFFLKSFAIHIATLKILRCQPGDYRRELTSTHSDHPDSQVTDHQAKCPYDSKLVLLYSLDLTLTKFELLHLNGLAFFQKIVCLTGFWVAALKVIKRGEKWIHFYISLEKL